MRRTFPKLKIDLQHLLGPVSRRKALMNKQRLEKAVPADAEAVARRVNAQPRQPPRGMVKLRCPDCRYWFAAPQPRTPRCPDCASFGSRA
jgi:hypothetical protein